MYVTKKMKLAAEAAPLAADSDSRLGGVTLA